MEPKPLTDLEVSFPTNVSNLMPDYKDIPEEYKRGSINPYVRFVSGWFYKGADLRTIRIKPGIDYYTAIRHLRAILGSFEPKHEHKMATVAYLMSQWFELPQ